MTTSFEERKAFLQSIKDGDEVAVSWRYNAEHEIRFVGHCTKTQIIVEPYKFRRENGRLVGNNLSHVELNKVTDEIKQQIEHNKVRSELLNALELIEKARNHQLKKMSVETMNKLLKALQEAIASEGIKDQLPA